MRRGDGDACFKNQRWGRHQTNRCEETGAAEERDVYVLDRIAYAASSLKYILWLLLLIYKVKP